MLLAEFGADMTQFPTPGHLAIAEGTVYQERGGDHFDRRNHERTTRKLTRQLEHIGFEVTLVRQCAAERPRPPAVDPLACQKCARWRLPRCIHAVPRNSSPDSTSS